MNDEMQESTEVEVENIENTNVDVESSTTAEVKPLTGFEKRVSVLTARDIHKTKENNQLKAELATLKAEREQASQVVEVPKLPADDLRYDNPEQYEQELRAYHDNIATEAVSKANKNAESNRVAERERENQSEAQTKQSEIVNKYIDNGIRSGISEVKMQANEAVFQESKIPTDLANFIYSDESGAQIVDYLADNPDKIQELRNAAPGQAFVMIANEIKPQALSSNPTQTNAPDPLSPTRGGGSPPSDEHPLLKGATFT